MLQERTTRKKLQSTLRYRRRFRKREGCRAQSWVAFGVLRCWPERQESAKEGEVAQERWLRSCGLSCVPAPAVLPLPRARLCQVQGLLATHSTLEGSSLRRSRLFTLYTYTSRAYTITHVSPSADVPLQFLQFLQFLQPLPAPALSACSPVSPILSGPTIQLGFTCSSTSLSPSVLVTVKVTSPHSLTRP